jgi:hypothetical protein
MSRKPGIGHWPYSRRPHSPNELNLTIFSDANSEKSARFYDMRKVELNRGAIEPFEVERFPSNHGDI